ncbi:phosphatase PAP2 family protein [Bacillus sp. FJAT-50079]|uniref:phosphatase PAP2 family protein n=1 Tax=Bacillus sp. FJAT-50079 TaxID=2833577 RepID=UPI001BC95DE6|nr:phosphatase PAP2 family protein [Bacillus sp. FJAT-50079]MBS4208444.1 phosphatase PAP2 family protein [Bacillus sp. FJAT-50079]
MKLLSFFISLVVFIGLALTFKQPAIVKYDVNILLFFEGIRTELFNHVFYLFTEIGSIKLLLPLAVLISIFLLIKKRYIESIFVMLTFWGVRGVNHLLKEWFERERPSFNSLIHAGDYSFPSGHVMNSIAFWGIVYYIFVHIIKMGLKRRRLYFCTFVTMIILIAISRVYLGVHYFTDVVAGACAGFVFLLIDIYVYRFLLKFIRSSTLEKLR